MIQEVSPFITFKLNHSNPCTIAPAPAVTNNKKQTKDWNKLIKEVDDEKLEGEAAVNALFQQIYRDADPDARRAMMKSFIESNGTCLSTNWSEVGSKKVETKPPEGTMVKKVSFICFSFFLH